MAGCWRASSAVWCTPLARRGAALAYWTHPAWTHPALRCGCGPQSTGRRARRPFAATTCASGVTSQPGARPHADTQPGGLDAGAIAPDAHTDARSATAATPHALAPIDTPTSADACGAHATNNAKVYASTDADPPSTTIIAPAAASRAAAAASTAATGTAVVTAAAAAAATDTAAVTAAAAAAATDEAFMSLALLQARAAAAAGEVPVGAVLVHRGAVLAAAHNRVDALRSPLAHAEMLCLASGASRLRSWRLLGATLYVTLEPCPMCAGALLQARVSRVVYGARQPRLGADGSWVQLLPLGSRGGAGAGGGEGAVAVAGAGGAGGGFGAGARSGVGGGCGCEAGGATEYDGSHVTSGEEERLAWVQPRKANGARGAPSRRAGASSSTSGGGGGRGSATSNQSSRGSGSSVRSIDSSGSEWEPGSARGARPVSPHPFHDSTVVEGGCMAEQCAELMRDFFKRRRSEQREAKGSKQEGRAEGLTTDEDEGRAALPSVLSL